MSAPVAVSSALSRRTLTRAAAWSVPAVTLAAASPALAASQRLFYRERGGLYNGCNYGDGG